MPLSEKYVKVPEGRKVHGRNRTGRIKDFWDSLYRAAIFPVD